MASPFVKVATGGRREIDAAVVRRALAALVDPNNGVFLQTLPTARWVCLPGNDLDALVKEVKELSYGAGTYFALNPCPVGQKITNSIVVRRRRMLFDFDPIRPKDSNATEDEHEAAREAACRAMDYLCEHGWPLPIGIDSGNGWHLVYAIDLPNDAFGRTLVRSILGHVASLFDTDWVKLGVECCDARRITKLPGTPTRKGPHSEERPQRWAKLVYLPEPLEVVPVEAMTALVARPEADAPALNGTPADTHAPEREPFVRRAGEFKSGRAYGLAAMKGESARIRMAPVQSRNNAVNKAAFNLGRLVQPGVLTKQEVEAEIEVAADANGVLVDEPLKTRDTIRRAIEAGMAEPRALPTSGGKASPAGANAGKPPQQEQAGDDNNWVVTLSGEIIAEGTPEYFAALAASPGGQRKARVFEILTIGELLEKEFDPPVWCIAGLLAEGLNLLVGSPKMGKSMLALNLALTVAAGGNALGDIRTVPGDVLYLSLEDQQRRVRARASEMVKAVGRGADKRLSVATEWPRMDQGGLNLLEKWVERVESPRLIIIDVLGRFRPLLRDRGSQYEQDSQHMYAIKELADRKKVTLQVVHHTRKTKGKKDEADDEMESISGTQGLAGGADGIILLHRMRHSNLATISMTSRDAPEHKLALEFTKETLTWKSLGAADDHLQGKLQTAVLAFMKARPGLPQFPSRIAEQLNADKLVDAEANADKVRVTLARLERKGLVENRNHTWVYPASPPMADVVEY